MKDLYYKVNLLSDWHCGCGLTSGSDVDLLVIKDENGLPYIPGKTIKGLLKEAAYYMGELSDDKDNWHQLRKDVFGIKTSNDPESNQSESGTCYFSNALLSGTIQNSLKDNEPLKPNLYRQISSTAIDENGLAKKHTLRKIEVVIPLELYGKIAGLHETYLDQILKCFAYVKQLGSHRNRGLGRCIITKWEDNQ